MRRSFFPFEARQHNGTKEQADIADPGLEAAVREALQKPLGPLSEQDLLDLANLNASGRSVSNLAGLDFTLPASLTGLGFLQLLGMGLKFNPHRGTICRMLHPNSVTATPDCGGRKLITEIKNNSRRLGADNRKIAMKSSTTMKSLKLLSLATLTSFAVAAQASAAAFVFSTGNPDGKIATLSRPAGLEKMQTETADDFVTTESIVINQATFTGLLPAGSSLGDLSGVEVEIYHVFPFDSVLPPSGNVPNRTNSPSDVEIDSATRDSENGTLAFSATLVSTSFTASNSVVNGINKQPGQRTNGEGPVSGQEVTITVVFNPPIALPADHYFFRPEVRLSSGDFLWLSAPRPIVAPGIPFATGTDLQSWIRNDALAPDWLRIGTDITGQGPFNAAFSLFGETDSDGDGVADSLDECPGTAPGAIVDADGCSIDQLAPCSGPVSGGAWKNHGQYVSSVTRVAESFLAQGLITEAQAEAIVEQAAQSECGTK